MSNWTNISFQGYTTSCSRYEDNLYLKDLDSLYITSLVLVVSNCFTAVSAILGNGLVILVVFTTSPLHSPANVLLCCLAWTDLLTGLITQPIWTIKLVARITENYPTYCYFSKLLIVPALSLNWASLFTLSMINLDRFLALNLHLRYREFVTLRRVIAVEAVVFVISISLGARALVAAAALSRTLIIVFLLLNILPNLILYKSISHTVRKHQRTIQAQQNIASHLRGCNGLDVKKYNKSVGTTALIFGAFCLCYVPTLCWSFVARVYAGLDVTSWEVRMGTEVSYMVLIFNSTLNPILYCLRIADIRNAAHRIFRKI